jgi:hypothetical protein
VDFYAQQILNLEKWERTVEMAEKEKKGLKD